MIQGANVFRNRLFGVPPFGSIAPFAYAHFATHVRAPLQSGAGFIFYLLSFFRSFTYLQDILPSNNFISNRTARAHTY